MSTFAKRQQQRKFKRKVHEKREKKLKRRITEQQWADHKYAKERRIKKLGIVS